MKTDAEAASLPRNDRVQSGESMETGELSSKSNDYSSHLIW